MSCTSEPFGRVVADKQNLGQTFRWHNAAAVLVALLLWFAALAKGIQLSTEPVANRLGWTTLVAFEWVLGVLLFLGLAREWTSSIVVTLFSVFAAVSIYQGLQGEASCGCFGSIEVSPWITLAVDLMVLALLLRFRPPRAELERSNSARGRIVLALVGIAALVPFLWFMASYKPATINPSGQIVGQASGVLLEPEIWPGKTFPLVDHIDIGQLLKTGNWRVLFYHDDCPDCRELVLNWPAAPDSDDRETRSAIIELPPYAIDGARLRTINRAGVLGRLRSDRRWYVKTPTILRLEHGIVTQVLGPTQSGVLTRHASSATTGSPKPIVVSQPADTRTPARDRHDFGYVEPDSTHTLRFCIENPLPRPLVIAKVDVECACMAVTQAPEKLAPGAQGDVEVTFHAGKEPVNYSKRVLLVTNDKDLAVIPLTISARIGLPLRVEPSEVDFGLLQAVGPHIKHARVFNDGRQPARLLYCTSDAPGCAILVPQSAIQPGTSIELPVSISLGEVPTSQSPVRLRVRTSLPDQREIEVFARYRLM